MRTRLNQPEAVRADQVVTMVATLNKVAPDDLTGRSQLPHLVDARREAAIILRKAGFSLGKIGEALNRDHTTILYLLNGDKTPLELGDRP